MSKFWRVGSVSLVVLLLAAAATAQRTGGAARSGMRGAMVGGMVGGSSGAATGAKVGVVTGVTRNVAERSANRQAVNTEAQTRAQYESSAAYQEAQHSNFNESSPDLLVTTAVVAAATPGTPATRNATMPATSTTPATSAAAGGDAIVREDGKPIVGIEFPADWKQKAGENYVSAVSPKANAWSVIATLDNAKDKEQGIAIVKQGLDRYLEDIQYDEPITTERGALLLTGAGNAKKTGLPVVFAAGTFNASPTQVAGAAFVVDQNVEEHYKAAVRYMCESIRGAADFTAQEHEVAKPAVR